MTRPLIGINTDVTFHRDGTLLHTLRAPYTAAIERAGGRPLLLPSSEEPPTEECLARLDGLLLAGGDDLDPRLFGGSERHPEEVPLEPRRERFDMALVAVALATEIPLLGICLGFQELAVARGGTLHQSLRESLPDALEHRSIDGEPSRHEIRCEKGSRLEGLFGPGSVVNSTHRQAVARPGEGQIVAARATDGVIEAIEVPGEIFRVAVQWHPELLPDDSDQRALFGSFVAAAARHATSRA